MLMHTLSSLNRLSLTMTSYALDSTTQIRPYPVQSGGYTVALMDVCCAVVESIFGVITPRSETRQIRKVPENHP